MTRVTLLCVYTLTRLWSPLCRFTFLWWWWWNPKFRFEKCHILLRDSELTRGQKVFFSFSLKQVDISLHPSASWSLQKISYYQKLFNTLIIPADILASDMFFLVQLLLIFSSMASGRFHCLPDTCSYFSIYLLGVKFSHWDAAHQPHRENRIRVRISV